MTLGGTTESYDAATPVVDGATSGICGRGIRERGGVRSSARSAGPADVVGGEGAAEGGSTGTRGKGTR